jgi:hypothetical protein
MEWLLQLVSTSPILAFERAKSKYVAERTVLKLEF